MLGDAHTLGGNSSEYKNASSEQKVGENAEDEEAPLVSSANQRARKP